MFVELSSFSVLSRVGACCLGGDEHVDGQDGGLQGLQGGGVGHQGGRQGGQGHGRE